MLQSLAIQNLATIESLTIDFVAGLNALTGETGAGKSIIIEALGLALGDRSSAESIREGAKLAAVEAIFARPFPHSLVSLIRDDLALAWDADEPLTLRREIAAAGRNRCLVNEQVVAVADLARIGELLVDFHGQHEHQSLLRKDAGREALDAFAGHDPLLAAYAAAYDELAALRKRRRELEAAARDFDQRADYLDFQLQELAELNPRPGELADLELEERRLAGVESLTQSAAEAYGILYEGVGDERPSLLALLRDIQKRIADLAEVEPAFAESLARLEEYKAGLEDLAYALRDYADSVEADPDRLNAVIERRDAIKRLIRKHGGTEESLHAAWETMRAERERMSRDQSDLNRIEADLAAAQIKTNAAAGALSGSRRDAADRFAKTVASHLKQLNMEKARFEARIAPLPEPNASGADDIELLLAANPGLSPAPLRKVGSGGELSRVMLALKSALAARDRIPTLVFDEIDTGVSGETAIRVARMLEKLGDSHQVLCITHHAPIAARATRHVVVRKESRRGFTFTLAQALAERDRLAEIARMMGGDAGQEAARELARELMR